MSDYDPGEPYDGPPPRRRRRYGGEYDDAWAAADDDAGGYGADPGELAAGYQWEDDARFGVNRDRDQAPPQDQNTLPSSSTYRRSGTTPPLRTPPLRSRRSRDPYPHSASYHTDQMRRSGQTPYDSYYDADSGAGGPLSHIPCWGIVIIVVLMMAAVAAVTLACVSVLLL